MTTPELTVSEFTAGLGLDRGELMRISNVLCVLGLSIVFLSGCGAGKAPLLTMPERPQETVYKFDVATLTPIDKLDPNDLVMAKGHTIPIGSKVIISVPREITISEKQKNREVRPSLGPDAERGDSFATDGYFSLAEQQIEKELIRKGFNVLSREKFEAKLRDLRDKSNKNEGYYSKNAQEFSPDVAALIEDVNKLKAEGKISYEDWERQVKEIRDRNLIASTGKNRKAGEQEMIDISEVIRAAQVGDVRSDYILQVNKFDADKMRKYEVNIMGTREVESFLAKFPEATSLMASKSKINCTKLATTLNAKLIEVETGKIVWIGSHAATSEVLADSKMMMRYSYRHGVSNYTTVKNFVDYNNKEEVRELRGKKSKLKVPEWEFSSALDGPNVISGHCDASKIPSRAGLQNNLSLQAARTLIRSIRMEGDAFSPDAQAFKQ